VSRTQPTVQKDKSIIQQQNSDLFDPDLLGISFGSWIRIRKYLLPYRYGNKEVEHRMEGLN
jgi:hypothetical protein